MELSLQHHLFSYRKQFDAEFQKKMELQDL